MGKVGTVIALSVDLDALAALAEAAADWLPDLPWSTSRHCFQASVGYVVGAPGHEELPSPPVAEALSDACSPAVVAALVRAVRAALDASKGFGYCIHCSSPGGSHEEFCALAPFAGEEARQVDEASFRHLWRGKP